MAQEALNDAGYSGTRMTVILNDNEMSISKNIGGMSLFLSKLRTKRTYTKSNGFIKRIVANSQKWYTNYRNNEISFFASLAGMRTSLPARP